MKRSLSILLVALSMPLSTLSVLAITAQDEAKLAVVEKNLFFKSYADEPILKRVERLEKRFFGEPLSGDTDERVAKIFEAAGPKVEADGSVNPGQLQTPQPAPGAPGAQPAPTASSAPQAPPDNDMEWEKASMAVMGARDQEIRSLLKDAIKLTKRKETDSAFEKLNQVIRLDPQNADGHFSLGVLYESKGNLQEALAEYNKAHDINPDRLDYKEAIVSIGEKGVKKTEYDQKQSQFNELAEEASGAFKRKEYISALELYKRLESDFPKNATYKFNIGTIYLVMRNPVQALEYYEMAKKLNPHDEKYSSAVSKLKETLKTDENKRKETEALWDAKEKSDKKREKDQIANKNSKQKGGGGKQPKGGPPPGFQVRAQPQGRPPQQVYGQPNQMAYQPQQPSNQTMPPPGGMPMYQQQMPNYQNQMPAQQQQNNQYQQGFNQQPGFTQQMPPGFNQPQQPGGYPQSFNQQSFNQPKQAIYPGQQMQTGFPPQGQSPVSPMSQPGFNQPAQNQRQPIMQQPNQGGVLESLGFLAIHSPQGLTVTTVGSGTRAAKAGLNKGDIIVAVDGVNITNMAQLTSILSRKSQGESTQVIINRKGNVGQVLL